MPDWMEPWMESFTRTNHAATNYVVSSTLDRVDWNAEFVEGDLGETVEEFKREPGKGMGLGGVKRMDRWGSAVPLNRQGKPPGSSA